MTALIITWHKGTFIRALCWRAYSLPIVTDSHTYRQTQGIPTTIQYEVIMTLANMQG